MPESSVKTVRYLLQRLADELDALIPNVKGASESTLKRASNLVDEAYAVSDSIGADSNGKDTLTSYSKAEMLDNVMQYMGCYPRCNDSEVKFTDYRDLGLLAAFVNEFFH